MSQNQPTEQGAVEGSSRSILRYLGLATLVTLIPSGVSGAIGYGFNELMRDRKVLEVSSTSSGNLASMPVSVAGNLEILLPVTATRKETIKSLFRYDVKITNKTEQGADDVALFLEPPKDIELVANAEITTVPTALASAIVVKQNAGPTGNPKLEISLINPSQTVKIGYLGFSRNITATGNTPLNAVVVKKDWLQRDVTESTPPSRTKDDERDRLYLLLTMMTTTAMMITILLVFGMFYLRQQRGRDDWLYRS
jgi:hypothetical protein